jgi:hypothetical protein
VCAGGGLTADDAEHAAACLQTAATRPPVVVDALLRTSRSALAALLALPEATAHLLDTAPQVSIHSFIYDTHT